jgi:molybdenum cofactor biosynthesis protein MoaC
MRDWYPFIYSSTHPFIFEMAELTHLKNDGAAHMVDVGAKDETHRVAEACAVITMSREAFDAIVQGNLKKGDALGVARIAGIMAAKRTSELIPLCHPIGLTKVEVSITRRSEETKGFGDGGTNGGKCGGADDL